MRPLVAAFFHERPQLLHWLVQALRIGLALKALRFDVLAHPKCRHLVSLASCQSVEVLLRAFDVLDKLHFVLLPHYLKIDIPCGVLDILCTSYLQVSLFQFPDFINYLLVSHCDLLLAAPSAPDLRLGL